MREIIFFSGNEGKITEIKNKFKNKQIKILSLKNFDNYTEPLENGLTFRDNAKIKSSYGYSKFNIPCFADDSGICIEALKNKPGIFSKSFIRSFKSSDDCFKYIFKKIKKTNKKKAYFKTSICLTMESGIRVFFEGRIKGTISEKPVGEFGFGYDPIFVPEGYNRTLGSMRLSEKNQLSHRSIAINKLINFLIN